MPGAFGPVSGPAPSTRPALKDGGPAEPGTDGVDLVAEVTTPEPYTIGRRAAASGRLRLRDQAGHPPPSRPPGHRRGGAGVDPGRGRAGPPARTACSSPTGRATRPRSATPPTPSATCSGRCRSSASAWATSCWRPPSGAAPTSCRSVTTAATTRCAGWRPARSRSPARTTTTPSPHGSRRRRRRHPRQPQRRRHRGAGLPRRAGLRRPVPPRGRTRPPRRQLPVRGVPGPDGERRLSDRCRDATTCDSILVIGSGPIVIGQACEFDYSGTQACRVLVRGGLPGHPGQLQPGDDHDRPGVRRPHLRRAADRRGAGSHRRARSDPTPSCRPSAGRPPSTWPWPCTSGAPFNASASR